MFFRLEMLKYTRKRRMHETSEITRLRKSLLSAVANYGKLLGPGKYFLQRAGNSNELRVGGGKPVKNSRNARSPARPLLLPLHQRGPHVVVPPIPIFPTDKKNFRAGPISNVRQKERKGVKMGSNALHGLWGWRGEREIMDLWQWLSQKPRELWGRLEKNLVFGGIFLSLLNSI